MSQAVHRGDYPADWPAIATRVKVAAGWICIRCGHAHDPSIGRCLTVHHFDGDKGNCASWNLMALCQACHLSVQARVDPSVPLMFDPSKWCLPYIAGLYESGNGLPGPIYDLRRWIGEYESAIGPWPEWGPRP